MNRKMRGILGAMAVAAVGAMAMSDPTPGVAAKGAIILTGSGRIEASTGDAEVATNATDASSISVSGSAIIAGNAYCGVGGNPKSAIKLIPSGQVTGLRQALTSPMSFMPATAPDLGASLGNFSQSWQTVTISSSGRYGDFVVTGSSKVRINGDVTIVTDGDFKVLGSGRLELLDGATLTVYAGDEFIVSESGLMNQNTADPSRVSVFVTGSTRVRVDGSGVCYGHIRSVDAPITVAGSGVLHGSFHGSSVLVEGSGILRVYPESEPFPDIAASSGFALQGSSDDDWSSGLHWADLDNDGDLDALVGGDSVSRRLMNNGGSFSSSTFGGGSVYRQGALLDIDHDGDLDFWGMTHYNTEACFTNSGTGSMSNAGHLGMPNPSNMEGIAAADVNGDGWCDVVVFAENGNWIGHHQGAEQAAVVGTMDSSYGLNDAGDRGNGDYCSSADVNNDGFMDFFYHYNGGKLFVSDGDGTYTQNNFGISVATGNDDKIGSAWGDYDNDGDVDLWIGRHDSGSTAYLWRNDRDWESGAGSFTNVASSAGITNTVGTRGCAWGDFDNDGDLDLYLATIGAGAPDLLYANNGDGTFTPETLGSGAEGDSQDAAFVDFDNDGDLDIAVTRTGASNALLRNDTNGDSYLKVRVLGAGAGKTNKAAIGVRVEMWSHDGSTYLGRREVGVARGFGGTEPLWLHFGGMNVNDTVKLKVFFTGGFVHEVQVTPREVSTTIGATTIDQMVTIDEAEVRSRARVVQWEEISPY